MQTSTLNTFRILRPDAATDIVSPLEIALELRLGVPAGGLDNVRAETGLSMGELIAVVGLSESTVKRRRSSGSRLPAEATDALFRLVHVFAKARAVLGSGEKARAWLLEPSRALNHHRPIDLATSVVGAQLLEEELAALEHGSLA